MYCILYRHIKLHEGKGRKRINHETSEKTKCVETQQRPASSQQVKQQQIPMNRVNSRVLFTRRKS